MKAAYPTMFALSAIIWCFMAGAVTIPSLLFGGVMGLICIHLLRGLYDEPFFADIGTTFKRIPAIIAYLGFFVRILLTANWDVLKRALHPELPVYPGIIKVNVRGKSPLEVMLIANTITLTPGTLTIDVSDDNHDLFVHCIDSRNIDLIREEIAEIEARVVGVLK